jgi:hypothetical protein
MKRLTIAIALLGAVACQTAAASAAECLSFTSGEILCDDGSYAYYWSPDANEWQVLDRETVAAALGLSTGGDAAGNPGGSATYGSDGSSLTTTDDGCMMYSAPGYSYGESLSFSSGC